MELQMDKLNFKTVELILKVTMAVSFILWFFYAWQNPSLPPLNLFLHYSFYIFLISIILFTIIHLNNWRKSVDNAESVIYEIVVYRKETPISTLATKIGVSKDSVYEIIQRMILNSKLIGRIDNGIFYSSRPRKPICPICREEITDSIRLITCPFCRKPFHKDHVLSYIQEVEKKCPSCKNILTLGELYL